ETDFTIADFVADLRAPTPSAAAELITAAQHRVEERLEELSQRLARATRYTLMQARERFSRLSSDAAFARMRDSLNRRQQLVDELAFRMESAWREKYLAATQRLQQLTAAVLSRDVTNRLALTRQRLESLNARLERAGTNLVSLRDSKLDALGMRLNSLSPLGILNRGYALVYDESGALVKDAASLQPKQKLFTRVAKGSIESTVIEITTEPEIT
ncbi:MAG: exodeoxyribonuclease VII large subunit, partial [Candidatus Eremiobacteraeota bacterium]|nr:exodeoxyribonuclease VII large subunit [Candidatus Eremiobacteraeota bacterium]